MEVYHRNFFCSQAHIEQSPIIRNVEDFCNLLRKKDIDLLRRSFPYLKPYIHDLDQYGNNPLHTAIKNDFWEGAYFLIENGADINATTEKERTPLHLAISIYSANSAFVLLLIEQGANLLAQDMDGKLPLHLAIKYGLDDEVVFTIINKGEGLTARDSKGFQPLHYALMSKRENIVMALLDRGISFDVRALRLALKKGLTEIAEHFLELGIDPTERGEDGGIALHWVSDVELCKTLLDRGLDLEAQDSFGYTPLLRALEYEDIDIARLFLDRGARVDVKTRDGHTALYLVSDLALAHRFIEKGIKPTTSDLDQAIEKERWDIAAFFLKEGVTSSDKAFVAKAMEARQWEVGELLLDAGLDPNKRSEEGKPPLHFAIIQNGPIEIIIKLLKAGANIEALTLNFGYCYRGKWTPLLWALKGRRWDVAELLLDEGANPNNQERSPLDIALEENASDELIRKLVDKGAIPEPPDGSKYYPHPLYRAFVERRFTISQLFLTLLKKLESEALAQAIRWGAPLKQIEILLDRFQLGIDDVDLGSAPIENAIAYKRWDIAKALLNRGAKLRKKAFEYAVRRNTPPDLMEKLWSTQTSVNEPLITCVNHTPLQAALCSEKWEVAFWFIEKGADVNRTEKEWAHPLKLAIEYEAPALLIDELKKRGAVLEPED